MRQLVVFLLAISSTASVVACAWDYDTLKMERERFPGALELIVGKFLRHSDTFYEWRVKDRTAKIDRHESGEATLSEKDLAAAYDDLAVAYDKLGRHDEAIEAIREKADKLPDVGEYETHANLGTFLVHAGRYEEGLSELNKAIEINPEAHFGREEYQILLVEYVIEKRRGSDSLTLPLDSSDREEAHPFADWLFARKGLVDSEGRPESVSALADEHAKAVKGLLGMMRFGDYRSPALLEALGDLMAASPELDSYGDSKQLAARAYLRAAEATTGPAALEYHRFAEAALRWQGVSPKNRLDEMMTLAQVEDQLAREVKEADAWFAEVAHDEELWVEKSPDPDRRYWEKYGDQVITVGHDRLPAGKFAEKGLPTVLRIAMGVAFVLTLVVVIGAMSWRRKRPTGYPLGERQAEDRV